GGLGGGGGVGAGDGGVPGGARGGGGGGAGRRRADLTRPRPGGVPFWRGEGAARGDRGGGPAPSSLPAVHLRLVHRHAADGMVGGDRPVVGRGRGAELQPDPREQRGDARERPADPRPRRRLVPRHGGGPVAGRRE